MDLFVLLRALCFKNGEYYNVRRLNTRPMNLSIYILAASFALVCSSFAGTRILTFIYQPLTTLGTEHDAAVVVARIPVLINAVPESIISAIGWPNKLLQGATANIADSNLLSRLDIHLSADLVSGRHYRVTLDLRDMRSCEPYGVTADEVIAGTIKCLRATFDEDENLVSYELRIQAKKDDKTDWSKYEGRYESKKKP